MLELLIAFFMLYSSLVNVEYNGIDISHHNTTIKWEEIRSDENVKFCYVKSTEGGTFVDPKCREHVTNAKANNLDVGLYHYFRTGSPAYSQFENFMNVYWSLDTNLLPVIDVEDKYNCFDETSCRELNNLVELFKKEFGEYPIVYLGSFPNYNTIKAIRKCPIWYRTVGFSSITGFLSNRQVLVRNNLDLNHFKEIKYYEKTDKKISTR